MYFPYFRGRQYELLALKELASQKLISESIIPIVEPIKQIPALKNALNNYFKADRFSPFLGYSIKKYPKGTELYRARICNDEKGFQISEMGAPPAHLRKAGRVNPEGIGVLYLTSDEQTALSEVRAGTFDYVTIGTFQLKKEIRVLLLF